jgi:hypothetical protein
MEYHFKMQYIHWPILNQFLLSNISLRNNNFGKIKRQIRAIIRCINFEPDLYKVSLFVNQYPGELVADTNIKELKKS